MKRLGWVFLILILFNFSKNTFSQECLSVFIDGHYTKFSLLRAYRNIQDSFQDCLGDAEVKSSKPDMKEGLQDIKIIPKNKKCAIQYSHSNKNLYNLKNVLYIYNKNELHIAGEKGSSFIPTEKNILIFAYLKKEDGRKLYEASRRNKICSLRLVKC